MSELVGKSVLLVEDEALVAMDLKIGLEASGARIKGPCLNLPGALISLGSPNATRCRSVKTPLPQNA